MEQSLPLKPVTQSGCSRRSTGYSSHKVDSYCTHVHVSVSVSTACVQVQGSTKRVADVCRLLKTVLGDNTLWSIDIGGNFTSSGAAKGDCVVLVERECRAGAMRVLIGGKNRNMLLEIEHKTRAKIKFVSNKQLKLYIQGGRSQVKAARLEIEQRLIKLGLGIVANQDDVVSPPIPPLTKAQLRAERRNAKKMERLDLEKQANAAKAAGKAAKGRFTFGRDLSISGGWVVAQGACEFLARAQ